MSIKIQIEIKELRKRVEELERQHNQLLDLMTKQVQKTKKASNDII